LELPLALFENTKTKIMFNIISTFVKASGFFVYSYEFKGKITQKHKMLHKCINILKYKCKRIIHIGRGAGSLVSGYQSEDGTNMFL
jgi:hypothetical protein